jgi:Molybdopterin converting factor, small subunit
MNTINIKILFFGLLKTYFGSQITLSIQRGATLRELLFQLKEKIPEVTEVLEVCQLAVNSTLVDEDFLLFEPDEVAILPPFSGG